MLEKVTQKIASDFGDYWYALSKSPKRFYQRLSATVTADGTNVVASGNDGGLAKWVSDKRPYIVEDFLREYEFKGI